MYLPDIVRFCHRRFYLYGKGDTAAIEGILRQVKLEKWRNFRSFAANQAL
jgi:hypothetical protein